ncbi:hypothetical protein BDV59DRAFT_175457, partial [Aspergillus ambiguus]|uniref:uncharacterized protein n=1 Tax=Aspergillus ambiguus TaxID=176160 RepID=UPI003CCD37C4
MYGAVILSYSELGTEGVEESAIGMERTPGGHAWCSPMAARYLTFPHRHPPV